MGFCVYEEKRCCEIHPFTFCVPTCYQILKPKTKLLSQNKNKHTILPSVFARNREIFFFKGKKSLLVFIL